MYVYYVLYNINLSEKFGPAGSAVFPGGIEVPCWPARNRNQLYRLKNNEIFLINFRKRCQGECW